MFTLETLIIFIVLTAAAAAVVVARRHLPPARLVCTGLFFLSLFVAYLLKLGRTAPTVDALIPFYKLFSINEYGYKGIFSDLIVYALPFVAAGFFLAPAFPKCNLFAALPIGIISAIALNLYPLFNDVAFISDEYIFAGLGCMAGYSAYVLLAFLLKKISIPERFGLPRPTPWASRLSFAYAAFLYFGIAIIMIVDHGQTYAPISFFESDTPLPQLALACTLETSSDKVNLYGPTYQGITERANVIAHLLGIEAPIASSESIYTIEDENARLTMTETGSWTYELLAEPVGDIPTENSAIATVYDLFGSKGLLSVSLDTVTDVVVRHDGDNAPAGYDIYISTAIAGNPIIGSSSLVVSVRADDTITRIRRYDGDISVVAERRIISQQRAYELLQGGRCAYTLFTPALSATIDNCYLAYMSNSSQGYYLPVWVFPCTATLEDGSTLPFEIYVEALR